MQTSDDPDDEMKADDQKATKGYLEVMCHLEIAYIEPGSSPRERIYSAWYAVFVFRIWRKSVKAQAQNLDKRSDALRVTMTKNFISLNLYKCAEINGHSFLSIHNRFRDAGTPQLFTPSTMNSQGCEEGFNSGERILLGDFLKMKYEGKVRAVQVLAFKFMNGKTFHGDHYSFKRAKEGQRGSTVMVFCNFFKENGNDLTPTKCQQRYIKVEDYIAHLYPKLEIRTGVLKL